MYRLWNLFKTTIGRKLAVSLSGIVLLLFIVGHAMGNLTIYLGQSALNSYAHWLQESPVLWLVRIAMLSIVLMHIVVSIVVTIENRSARTLNYQAHNSLTRRVWNKRMIISGLILLVFIIAHLAHLTLGYGTGEEFFLNDQRGYLDVYTRVVIGFQNPWIAWAYITAMVVLSVHLKHTVRALFQTLGFYHDNYFSFFEFLSWLVTLFVVTAFVSIPLAIQLNWLASS